MSQHAQAWKTSVRGHAVLFNMMLSPNAPFPVLFGTNFAAVHLPYGAGLA